MREAAKEENEKRKKKKNPSILIHKMDYITLKLAKIKKKKKKKKFLPFLCHRFLV